MITSEQFKAHATRFRRKAKKLEFDYPLTMLLDMYAFAHYDANYNIVYSRRDIDEPEFPPPFLENTAWRFDIEAARILEALEGMPRFDPPLWPEAVLTAEAFRQKAKLFRQVAPMHGIKLKMTSASDLYSLMFFDRRYSQVMAALGDGKQLGQSSEPEYLNAACALFGVNPRDAYRALCSTLCYCAE
jgi:hypothetical protein